MLLLLSGTSHNGQAAVELVLFFSMEKWSFIVAGSTVTQMHYIAEHYFIYLY